MRQEMSLSGRRELTGVTRERYVLADRAQKAKILDEFVEATSYHRKYAIGLLLKVTAPSKKSEIDPARKSTRRRHYDAPVSRALLSVWEMSGHLCSKRLVPFLPELLEALERHGEIAPGKISAEVRDKLMTLSASTCDRLLAPNRRASPVYGKSTTKPGTLLKHQIPIRTFADWQDCEKRPGFCEIDLVAHCGTTTAGEYANTLTVTDVFTGWTECQAIVNRSQQAVSEAIETIRRRLPFALLGIDSDNGGEFINANLLRYCQQEQITFTRCRPYKKNDQCHVEQKNWAVVRQYVGYSRLEGEALVYLLNRLYLRLRLHLNYFQPSLKLGRKERNGARVKKRYDTAQTPFRRLLTWKQHYIGEGADRTADKEALEQTFLKLNPAQLRRQIEVCQKTLNEKCLETGSAMKSGDIKDTLKCTK